MRFSRRKKRVAWTTAYVAFGGNMGRPRAAIEAAIGALDGGPTRVEAVSSLYRTAPIGGPPQPDFLNGALKLRTRLPARALLERLLDIERRLGRRRRTKWGPRRIDLDLLLYGRRAWRGPGLDVPHPRMHERRFVLAPLAEIAPRAIHPLLRRRVDRLLAELTPPGGRVTILAAWTKSRFRPSRRRKKPNLPSSR